MKLFKLLSIAIVLSLFSCEDDPVSPNNPPTNNGSNSFTLKKDGITYNPIQIIVSQVDLDMIGIEARAYPNNVTDNAYGIFLKRSITPGIYTLSNGDSEYFELLHAESENNYFGWEDGTLEVVSNDTVTKMMHCKFAVTLYNDGCVGNCPEITNGEFNIHYP